MDETFQRRAASVRLVIFDVDGVLTDGRLYFDDAGREVKAFDVKDGHGIRLLLHYGVQVAALSGRRSEIVARRMKELGVGHVLQGERDKGPAFERLLAACGVEAGESAYMGDDLPDLAAMRRAGLACAPADARAEVIECADWVSSVVGGRGAARELCDAVLTAQGRWQEVLEYCSK